MVAKLFLFLAVMHPLHLSLTNLVIKDDFIEVKHSLFKDDVEIALGQDHQPLYIEDININNYTLVKKMVENNFIFTTNDTNRLLADTIIIEIDDGMLNLTYELPKAGYKELKLKNTLLMDVFLDQVNLVIFGEGKKQQGIKFDYANRIAEIEL